MSQLHRAMSALYVNTMATMVLPEAPVNLAILERLIQIGSECRSLICSSN